MKITDFITTPTLTKVTATSEEIIDKYGEPLDFYIQSPMPLDEYVTLNSLSKADFAKKMILDEEGKPALKEGESLAALLLSSAVEAIWIELGKLPEKR